MMCSNVKPRNRGMPSCQLGQLHYSHGALFAAEPILAAESSTFQTSKGSNTGVDKLSKRPVDQSVVLYEGRSNEFCPRVFSRCAPQVSPPGV